MKAKITLLGLERVRERLLRVRGAMETAPRRVVRDVAREVESTLQAEAPRRTGQLRRGIRARVEDIGDRSRARFTSDAEYTPFVIKGTEPHDIFAGFYRAGGGRRALWWPTAPHPVPIVHHPGTRPDEFPQRAMRRARVGVQARLREELAEIVRGQV